MVDSAANNSYEIECLLQKIASHCVRLVFDDNNSDNILDNLRRKFENELLFVIHFGLE